MSDQAPDLEGELGVFLGEVASLAKLLRADEGAGGSEALEILDRLGPQTVPQIARIRNTSRQNIQIVVNRLQREGYVELKPNPGHKRSDLVWLTEKGQVATHEIVRSKNRVRGLLAAQISGAKVTAASELLRQAREVLAGQSEANSRQGIPSAKKTPIFKSQELQKPEKSTNYPSQRKKQGTEDKPKVSPLAPEPEEEGFPINLL